LNRVGRNRLSGMPSIAPYEVRLVSSAFVEEQ